MNSTRFDALRNAFVLVLVCLAQVSAAASAEAEPAPVDHLATQDAPAFLQYDPSKVLADETNKCGMCHLQESKAWMQSAHHMTYEERHWSRQAQAIVKRLGERSLKRNSECVLCHYTETSNYLEGKTRAVLGVSCQRCHGPAMDWWGMHDKGHRESSFDDRAGDLEARGMRHSRTLYELYATCYQCHTVPRENLVNNGRHDPGTLTFELVEWAEGEVRHHNFRLHNREGNELASLEHRRFLYVLGKMLDLEYGLRGLAFAGEEGRYIRAQQNRVRLAAESLEKLALDIPEVNAVTAIAGTLLGGPDYAELPIEGRAEYVHCAGKIAGFARQFEKKRAGYRPQLAKVDPFLPEEYRGKVYR
jgi:hypothetical protein